MLSVFQNSILILALLVVLAEALYPKRPLRLISMFLLLYYIIILLRNDITKESLLFLASLILLFRYLFWRLFQNTV
jgi:hypothetical protein